MRYTKKLEKERLFAFLHGLNKDLDKVRGLNLGTKPLPRIQDAFAEVKREKSRKRVMLRTSKDPSVESLLQNAALVTKYSSLAYGEQCLNYGEQRTIHGEQRPNFGEQRSTPDQRVG